MKLGGILLQLRKKTKMLLIGIMRNYKNWAVVVVQVVERSLLTPEIRGSNPIIGKVLYAKFSTNCNIEKMKIKKRGRERPIFKKTTRIVL